MFLIWLRTGFICKNYEFNQRKCVLLARVSSKQEHRLHRPTYFVSDITHSPLNGLFSSTRPIALNYHTSRRLRRYSRAKLEWYWYISLCIVRRIDRCSCGAWRICIPVESFKLDNFSPMHRFAQCSVEFPNWLDTLRICHFLLDLSNSMIFRHCPTWYLFYINKKHWISHQYME